MGLLSGRGKKKGQEGYGVGKAAISARDDVLLDEDAMVEELLACIEAPDYKPPTLPAVAMELMALSQRADVDLADVVALLEKDSLIAGRVLKLVQSAAYSGAAQITSLHNALVRVGLQTLRDLVMQIAMDTRVFKSPDYSETMECLRRHSMVTAHLSRLISKYTAIEGEYAFMAGLLHDVGIAGTLLALSDRKKRQKPPDLIAIWPALHRVHERAAELMAEQWSLPAEIKCVIASHHQVLIGGHAHPISATVCLADDLAHELGYGVIPRDDDLREELTELEVACIQSHSAVDRSGPKTLETSRQALQLAEGQLELIRGEGEELAGQLLAEA